MRDGSLHHYSYRAFFIHTWYFPTRIIFLTYDGCKTLGRQGGGLQQLYNGRRSMLLGSLPSHSKLQWRQRRRLAHTCGPTQSLARLAGGRSHRFQEGVRHYGALVFSLLIQIYSQQSLRCEKVFSTRIIFLTYDGCKTHGRQGGGLQQHDPTWLFW